MRKIRSIGCLIWSYMDTIQMDFLCSIFPREPCPKFFTEWPGVQRNWYDYKSILHATSHSRSQRTSALRCFWWVRKVVQKSKERARIIIFFSFSAVEATHLFCFALLHKEKNARSGVQNHDKYYVVRCVNPMRQCPTKPFLERLLPHEIY